MDNITVVFVAFESFHTRGFAKSIPPQIGKASSTGSSADLDLIDEDKPNKREEDKGLIHPIFSRTQNAEVLFVVDEEEMENTNYPEYCISDFDYIKGECPTPPYLRPKPKNMRKKFDCPVIITTNPEELHSVPQEFPDDFYDFLTD
jgi:hypothetical protein